MTSPSSLRVEMQAVDASGLVAQFAMNDRCAAGTGKFLEVLARAVNVEIEDMGQMALTATESVKVTSMCATFAETEVIALLAEGCAKPVVLDGVHAAVAKRIVGLVARVGPSPSRRATPRRLPSHTERKNK